MHRVTAPGFATLVAILVAGGLPARASAADPGGIWAKDDGSAKMQVTKCGRGLCSKIVWLENPKDSRGKPLVDARNEDSSKRRRPIIGMSLFSNMVPKAPNVWVGNVYNPEEGRTYTDVTVTLASSRQIVLRGCKGWLLCGEKVWTKSKLDKAPAEVEEGNEADGELIEVKSPKQREPEKKIVEARADGAKASRGKTSADSDIAFSDTGAIGPGTITILPGMEPLPLAGETVSSMMVMTGHRHGSDPIGSDSPTLEASASPSGLEPAPPVPQRAPRSDDDTVSEVAEAPDTEALQADTKPKVAASKPKVTRASAAEAPKPKPKVRQAKEEPKERLPWQLP